MNVPVLGYVIRMFPQVSETFIANEILSLERLGVPLRIYSYRQPQEDVAHECVRQIKTPITYLPDPLQSHLPELLAAQFAIAASEPARYSSALTHVASASLNDRSIQPWKRLLQAGYLAWQAKQSGVERLHAHFAHGSTHVAMLASIMTGIPFSFSAHARDIYNNESPRLLREKIRAAELVLTCTRANQQHLQSLVAGRDAGKIQIAYHGVDLTKFMPGETTAHENPPLILSVGRLVEKKGLTRLVRACRALNEKNIAFRCEIIGEGPQRPLLEMQIKALGLEDKVMLAGACTQEELLDRYRAATVFALPCNVLDNGDRDGIPNVLVEAMACELPVVSTAISGIPELIESGASGLLVPPENPVELAAALELLLHDGELRERLGRTARATVEERFDSSKCARHITRLLGARREAAIAS